MSATSIALKLEANLIRNTAKAVSLPRMTPRTWFIALYAVAAWSACVAFTISIYVQHAPRVHDEFSYMLGADTLLHGRLANPTPPVWEALQSFHTVVHPNYASKYPVGAGLLVALGMVFGMPLASSWLGAALMTVCVTWMIAGVLPKRWAIFGGVLISLSPFIQLAWSQSLLHGFLPASGNALLMGGVLRLRRRVDFSTALASGFGVGLLAISRPFEGLCCTLICTSVLWFAWSRHGWLLRSKLALRTVLFAAAPILSALILIAAHNHAVTGDWRKMPYQLHELQYGVAPLFVFSPPNLNNTAKRIDLPAVFHDYHAIDSLNWYRERVGVNGWMRGVYDACRELFKVTFPLSGLLLIGGLAWSNYRLPRALALAVAIQVAASACVCWVYSHYLAPILPWLLLLSLLSARISLRENNKLQAQLVRLAMFAIVLIEVASLVVFAGVAKRNEAELWSRKRQNIVQQLSTQDGRHLVLVRYTAKHNVHQEWVYNLACPSECSIVWARYEDGRWISALLKEYPDRTVWEIEADEPQPTLKQFFPESDNNASDASGH